MSNLQQNLLPPALSTTTDGRPRHVGFEIEFGGLTFESCLDALRASIGRDVTHISPVEATIVHPDFGEFTLELDWQFLKQQAKADLIEDDVVKTIASVAGTVVPLELVFPPIDVTQLDQTNEIVESLIDAGATGTDESFLFAFGVHINTEIPELRAPCIVRYLKAYCILQDYLVEAHGVNAARRISPYVDLYPPGYLARVLGYSRPDMDTVITDYLQMNATRNRALDMLPLFSTIDEEKIRARVPDNRIKKRPAFHYRLPNCDIGTRDWSLITEWNRWCLIEVLANDEDQLQALATEYQKRLRADRFSTDARWLDYIRGIANQINLHED
ncbi:MAG: amidoligase family protein [Pseudomonadales bacterium]